MNEHSVTSQPVTPIPPDDLQRNLKIARPNTDQSLPHLGIVGNTYTILISGDDTNGRYSLIDMHVLPGGGPPPHRHDFEESYTVLEGEIQATFRGNKSVFQKGNLSTSRPTPRTISPTSPSGRRDYCASAHQRDKRSSSSRSVYLSRPGLLRRQNSTRPRRQNPKKKRRNSRPNTVQNF